MKKILAIFMVCLAGGLIQSCSSGRGRPGDDEIISAILKYSNPCGEMDGRGSFLLPDTSFYSSLRNYSKQDMKGLSERLQSIAKDTDCDFEDLLMELIERNEKPVRLTVKSDPSKGIYMDYKGIYNRNASSNWKNWMEWCQKNSVSSVHAVSLPAYDPSSGIVLIYVVNNNGPLAASGGLVMYKYENGKVTHIGGMALWIS